MYTIKPIEGYSLIEVLVAIAILLLALVGPMTIASKGIQSADYIREQTVAIFLAQEGIEAFQAIRNDATIAAFHAGNLSTSWDWVTDPNVSTCLSGNGCNLDFSDNAPVNHIVSCTLPNNCMLYFDATKNRARYSLDSSGAQTQYRREIKITPLTLPAGNKGIEIASTVYWYSRLFGSTEQHVTLTSDLFSLYE